MPALLGSLMALYHCRSRRCLPKSAAHRRFLAVKNSRRAVADRSLSPARTTRGRRPKVRPARLRQWEPRHAPSAALWRQQRCPTLSCAGRPCRAGPLRSPACHARTQREVKSAAPASRRTASANDLPNAARTVHCTKHDFPRHGQRKPAAAQAVLPPRRLPPPLRPSPSSPATCTRQAVSSGSARRSSLKPFVTARQTASSHLISYTFRCAAHLLHCQAHNIAQQGRMQGRQRRSVQR